MDWNHLNAPLELIPANNRLKQHILSFFHLEWANNLVVSPTTCNARVAFVNTNVFSDIFGDCGSPGVDWNHLNAPLELISAKNRPHTAHCDHIWHHVCTSGLVGVPLLHVPQRTNYQHNDWDLLGVGVGASKSKVVWKTAKHNNPALPELFKYVLDLVQKSFKRALGSFKRA